MYAGAGLQRVYEKYDKNTDKVIYLDANIRTTDTKAIILAAYKKWSNVEPTFPIILSSQGGRMLAGLFTEPGFGGPTFIVSPNRKFFKSPSYLEADLIASIDKALATNVQSSSFTMNSGIFITKTNGNAVTLYSSVRENVVVRIFSLNGRALFYRQGLVTEGENVISLNSAPLPKGFYIVDIGKNNNIVFESKLLVK